MNVKGGFFKVCKYSDLKENIGQRFFVDNVDVAIFKVEGKVYALANVCLHQKAAIIYEGFVEDGIVTCPAHGWQFELKTGKVPFGISGLASYEVEIINDDVYVKVFKKQLNW
jgi:nitrite reductase/ring-hydroxylating ferredoxin subunit